MPDYLELYNLELPSGSSYTAQFIATPSSALPSECFLPSVLAYTPPTPIDYTVPDLTCKFDIDQPIIPPPFFCTPKVSGGFNIVFSSGSVASASGGASISYNEDTECDYVLAGGIMVTIPEIPEDLCTPNLTIESGEPSFTADVDTETINGTITLGLSLTKAGTDCDPTLSLAIPQLTASLNLKETYCASVIPEFSVTELVIPITVAGNVAGSGELKTSATVVVTGTDCNPSFTLNWTGYEASLNLSSSSDSSSSSTTCCDELSTLELTVCQGGSLTTITVYGYTE